MAHDYRGFQDKMAGDLSQASVTAQGYGDNKVVKSTKVRIRQSDLETLVPTGATVEFLATPCHKLKFGDIIFVRKDKEFVLRRFLAFEMIKKGTMIAVARVAPPAVETYPDSAIIGRVMSVEVRGKSYDPHKVETLMDRFKNEWTCFGTSTPFKRMANGVRRMTRLLAPKKKG
jgi:hypothetical protein